MTQVRQSITKGDYDVENVSKIKYNSFVYETTQLVVFYQ